MERQERTETVQFLKQKGKKELTGEEMLLGNEMVEREPMCSYYDI